MAATTKLIVYNEALREIGSHPLADIATANPRLQELNGAFDHAVEYMLAKVDWNFARRRASLTTVANADFTPYTYRYTKPADFLRKIWIKAAADDEFQIEHAEQLGYFYGFASSAPLMEYLSDHADNYDPANWPPHFTRCLVLYLALLIGPKLARTGDDDVRGMYQKLDIALSDAEKQEKYFTPNAQVASNRLPVIRRAIEMMGQTLTGSIQVYSNVDMLKWHMNKAWADAVRYCLHQGAWNFASKRALYENGAAGDTYIPTDTVTGIVEGYSVAPATSSTPPSISGYDYSYPLPDDFLHKIWIKSTVDSMFECHHQILLNYIFTNEDPCVMEYIAEDDNTTDPTNWPYPFGECVSAYLALMVSPQLVLEMDSKAAKVKANEINDKMHALFHQRLSDAKMRDAIQQEPKNLPLGRFARARFGSIGTTSVRRYN